MINKAYCDHLLEVKGRLEIHPQANICMRTFICACGFCKRFGLLSVCNVDNTKSYLTFRCLISDGYVVTQIHYKHGAAYVVCIPFQHVSHQDCIL